MNSYTNKNHFTESAEYILDNSELLIPGDCIIHNDILYERIDEPDRKYRFFFNCDDYDYLENPVLEIILDKLTA